MKSPLPTDFAPAERTESQDINRIAEELQANPLVNIFNAIPIPLIIINSTRQAVFCNHVFQHASIHGTIQEILGLRPGEALGCIHAHVHQGGCGSSKFCKDCGAASAIIKSLGGENSTDECRILRNINHEQEALNLQVFTSPFSYHEQNFILFTALDISHEKRKQNLEHLFYHDILNLVTGLKYTAQMVCKKAGSGPVAEKCSTMNRTISRIAEEIQAQKALSSAEAGTLAVCPQAISTFQILNQIKEIYSAQQLCENKTIFISADSPDIQLETDPVILSRILGNMVKNALEASEINARITIGSRKDAGGVTLWVHNEHSMEETVQRQVFKRAFSTKGRGRGLGTYSMKLLAENFLKGKVAFNSTPDQGTTFSVLLPDDNIC